ncbi:glycosyltransferase [Burkholderia vietnamiensis]|uniref:glycosyltransferase n=1 Tax=Burkholderia vietnamiensis TaxID=60552 RepID=UPI000D78464C|nr:glycosyltransferase family A protein [Burkholderia vietnamiensis]GBH26991.1 glycosyl transferase [Burkholderia vietnamiensis]
MKFSLIMATLGRSDEIERMLDSLLQQAYADLEVIIVDQNPDARVARIVERYRERLCIVHLRSEKGKSRATNVGLQAVTGDVVAFPDDDCWYRPGTLHAVAALLSADRMLDGVTGMSIDAAGRPSQGRGTTAAQPVNRFNGWVCAASYPIFLRRAAVSAAGQFDVELGVGATSRWGAGEEVDFLVRALRAGCRIGYDPQLRVHHPEPLAVLDEHAYARGRRYNRGFGHVLRINRYPLAYVLYMIARPVAGCALAFARRNPRRAKYYWIAASHRLPGWMD